MGVWGKIRSKFAALNPFRRKSANEVDRLLQFLGVDRTSGSDINEATFFACMRLLSESIGKLPLKLLQYTERQGVQTMRRDPRYYILGSRPNPYMTATLFWSTVEYNRSYYGN